MPQFLVTVATVLVFASVSMEAQTMITRGGARPVRPVQRWGSPLEEIRAGDVVTIPPAEKHWHGATPTTAMTHIAIQEALDGKVVEWMEKVSDEQYQA